ncbi:MAG: pectinesterase family protein [Nitrospirales bacterium]
MFQPILIILLSFLVSFPQVGLGFANPQETIPYKSLAPAVWQVALDGSGHFTSIQEAIDQAASGDTILIKTGSYAEDVTVHSKDGLSIIGEGMDQVILTGKKRVGTLHIGKWPYGATNVTIQGLSVIQHGGLGVGIFNGSGVRLKQLRVNGMVFSQQVQDVQLEDCVIGESETTGIAFADSTGTLTGNLIYRNDHGVAIGGNSDVTLRRNVITGSLYEAVLMTDQSKARLIQNTLVHNGGGAAFQDDAQADVQGNIISNSAVGLLFFPRSHTTLAFNALYDNQGDYVMTGNPPTPIPERAGETDVMLAPGFVNPEKGDFRLRADSSMIKVGAFPYLGALPPVSSNP